MEAKTLLGIHGTHGLDAAVEGEVTPEEDDEDKAENIANASDVSQIVS